MDLATATPDLRRRSTVWVLHYGPEEAAEFVGVFESPMAAEARVSTDAVEYARLGCTDWPADRGPAPVTPVIRPHIVWGLADASARVAVPPPDWVEPLIPDFFHREDRQRAERNAAGYA